MRDCIRKGCHVYSLFTAANSFPLEVVCNVDYDILQIDLGVGIISYVIKTGVLPVTVDLTGDATLQNIHTVYEEGSFSVGPGAYTITFTDAFNCEKVEDIAPCVTCEPGYTSVGNNCELLLTEPAIDRPPYLTVGNKTYYSYTNRGTLIFDSFNLDGTGTYERIDISNPYWINPYVPNTSLGGPMNRSAVWSTVVALPKQDVGFSVCLDLPVAKTYYVGVGCDNWSWIKLNGEVILNQNVSALEAMLGYDSNQAPFKYWFIYPVYMEAGKNILEVYGHNEYSVAAVGIEVYNATPETLKAVTSDLELGDALLFRAKDEVGQMFSYTYSLLDGVRGQTCRPGYALNTCEGAYFCERKITVECGQPIADINEKIVTYNANCSGITYPELSDNTLTKQYIADNFFNPAINVEDIEYIEIVNIWADENASIKYNGLTLTTGQIDFVSAPSINFYTNNYREIDTSSTIGFNIKLVGESMATQEVLYTFISEACTIGDMPVAMYVSIDTVLNGPYDFAIELPITYNPGTIVTFAQPTTITAQYHYMFISIPEWVHATIYDALDNNLTSKFTYYQQDNRAGYANNKIYKYNQPFGTSTPVTFKILVTND